MSQKRKNDLPSALLCPSGNDDCENLEQENGGEQESSPQEFVKVWIFSPDPFIREFLHEILSFQGCRCVETAGIQNVFWNLIPQRDQVVFLDGVSLIYGTSERGQRRVKEIIQTGVHVFVLGDRRWSPEFSRTLAFGNCQILWKPLDYQTIGQALAQVWA